MSARMGAPIRSCRSPFRGSLQPEDRNRLARDTTRELLGERFAYTLGRPYASGQGQHRAAAHAPDVLGTGDRRAHPRAVRGAVL